MPMSAACVLPDINADLDQRARVDTTTLDWEASPSGTVWRKPLYRQGGEYGPVTSLVRYAPGGVFRPHAHPEGEEILVLEGIFADEHGEYPAGSYLLNPEGSTHAPRSETGCTLFVRLRQYAGADRVHAVVNTTTMPWAPGTVAGLSVKTLYTQAAYPERMALVRWAPGTVFRPHVHPGGEEILVLEGELCDEWGRYGPGCWLRNPHMSRHTPYSECGCLIYVRVGGL